MIEDVPESSYKYTSVITFKVALLVYGYKKAQIEALEDKSNTLIIPSSKVTCPSAFLAKKIKRNLKPMKMLQLPLRLIFGLFDFFEQQYSSKPSISIQKLYPGQMELAQQY